MKYSIIIPAYNSEQYISKCLDSILKQNIDNYEIICVDDGSTDSTKNIIEYYMKRYSSIRLLSQENKGAGAARNRGLHNARGDYVLFLDSDDYYNESALKYVDKLVTSQKSDIYVFNYYKIYDDSQTVEEVTLFNIKNQNTITLESNKYFNITYKEYSAQLLKTSVVPWNKCYNRKFLIDKKLLFDEITYANDRSFYFKSISSSNALTISNFPLVYYRRNNPGTLTQHFTLERLKCHIYSYWSTTQTLTFSNNGEKTNYFETTINDILSFKNKMLGKKYFGLIKEMHAFFNVIDTQGILGLYSNNNVIFAQFLVIKNLTHLFDNNNKNIIPIVFSADANYAPYLAVSIHSLIKNSNADTYYDVYIFHLTGIGITNIEKIKQLSTNNIHITFVNVTPFIKDYTLFSRAHYSKSMFNRILIPNILFYYDKVCYLDSDTIILDDLSEFYNTDLCEKMLGAVKNICNDEMHRYVHNILNLDPKKYFNSGVLLINCNKFNKLEKEKQCLSLLDGNKKFVCPDQDVLNLISEGDTILVSNRWNYQWHSTMVNGFNKDFHNVSIIHYTTGNKPWNKPEYYLSKYFWHYARETDYYEEIIYRNVISNKNISTYNPTLDTESTNQTRTVHPRRKKTKEMLKKCYSRILNSFFVR